MMSNSENRFPGWSSEVAHGLVMKPGSGQRREERACPRRRLHGASETRRNRHRALKDGRLCLEKMLEK